MHWLLLALRHLDIGLAELGSTRDRVQVLGRLHGCSPVTDFAITPVSTDPIQFEQCDYHPAALPYRGRTCL